MKKEIVEEMELYKSDIFHKLDKEIRKVLSSKDAESILNKIVEAIKKVGKDENAPTPILKQFAYEKLCDFMKELLSSKKINWRA